MIEQQEGERNFHCFYQLLSGLSQKQFYGSILNEIDIDFGVKSYRYLQSDRNNRKNSVEDQEKDRKDFDQVLRSLQRIGFEIEEIQCFYKILASILVLGNLQFNQSIDNDDDDDNRKKNSQKHSKFEEIGENRKFLQQFCRMMSIEIDLTKRTLLNRSIRMVTEVIHKPYLELEAQRGRDALAKQLFQNLFSYLIKRINYFLRANRLDSNSSDNFSSQDQNDCGGFCTNTTQNNHECFETKQLLIKTIGILDINGFEVFQNPNTRNGFEQLLINYCNEKLHQLFIDIVQRREQSLYNRECLQWQEISYENNDDVCRLFETKPNGIFSLLDEACLVGKNFFNDFRLLELFDQRIIIDPNENFRTKFRFASESDRIVSNRTDFILKHFAGEVQYSIENFIEKNLDQIFDDHIDLLRNTNNGRLKGLIYLNRNVDLLINVFIFAQKYLVSMRHRNERFGRILRSIRKQ